MTNFKSSQWADYQCWASVTWWHTELSHMSDTSRQRRPLEGPDQIRSSGAAGQSSWGVLLFWLTIPKNLTFRDHFQLLDFADVWLLHWRKHTTVTWLVLHKLAFILWGVVSFWWWGVNLVRTSHAQRKITEISLIISIHPNLDFYNVSHCIPLIWLWTK